MQTHFLTISTQTYSNIV